MPVSTKAKEYKEKLPQWQQVDDCVNDRVKAGKTTYLPKPNPSDQSPENTTRYNQYLQRALFMNVVKRTHDGFLGAVYRKDPVIDLPTHGGRKRRVIPTVMEVAMYLKNNPKYECINDGVEKIWRMKI